MNQVELAHMLRKCREARDADWHVLSTGEKIAAAFVLNRPGWLAEMKFTLAEAIDRLGPEWLALVPVVARMLEEEP